MNSKNIKILIDMDDTLEDLLESWVAELNKMYGTNVNHEDIDDWDIGLFFPTLTRFQIFEPLFTCDFWDSVKPKEDAVKYVKSLKTMDFKCMYAQIQIIRH